MQKEKCKGANHKAVTVEETTAPAVSAGLAATETGAAGREQGCSLLELLEAPVHLLYLCPVLCPHPAQLLQQVLVGADQGAAEQQETA